MKKELHNDKEIVILEIAGNRVQQEEYGKQYFKHVLFHQETAQFRMENRAYQLGKNDIFIQLPATEVIELKRSRDFKATCLYVTFDLMSKNNPDIGWGIKAYLFSRENPVVHLSETGAHNCLYNFKLLQEKYRDHKHLFRKEVGNLQLQMFVMDMWNIVSKEIEMRAVSNQKGSLFEQFLQLVQEHCMEEREVEFYAARLFITPKYLTEVCKKNSSQTASAWIQNYTTQRLVILLQNQNLSFTQVADTLNFSSLSFFSRYVKKVLGVSPSEYRSRMVGL